MSSYRVLGLGQPLLDRILQVDEEVLERMGITERGGSSLFTTSDELEQFKSRLQTVLTELSQQHPASSPTTPTTTTTTTSTTTTPPTATSTSLTTSQPATTTTHSTSTTSNHTPTITYSSSPSSTSSFSSKMSGLTIQTNTTSSSPSTSSSSFTQQQQQQQQQTQYHLNVLCSRDLSPTSPYYYQLTPHQLPVSHVRHAIIVPGGSCANTIKGLASLGEKTAFIGKIGRDDVGQLYKDSMQVRGIIPLMTESMNERTGEVICLITPNGERTMRAFLGASLEMSSNDLLPQDFAHVHLLHVEGYSIYNQPLTLRAMQLAKQHQSMVSFDLGSFELVRQFKPLLLDMLRNYVDIVFSNSEEARELMGVSYDHGGDTIAVAEQCVDYLAKFCKVAVVMMGRDGCWVKSGNEKYQCPADVVQNPVDTTGAGDLFAAGFLYAYLQGYSLQQCARMGALSGKEVLFVMGAEVPVDRFKKIKTRVNSSVFHTSTNTTSTTVTSTSTSCGAENEDGGGGGGGGIAIPSKGSVKRYANDDDDECEAGSGFVIGEFSAKNPPFI